MPASPSPHRDSAISISEIESNENIAAETVVNTVMAEQVGHHVVNESESTSGSPLVDVAANQSTTATADRGTTAQALNETKTDTLQTVQTADENATDANAPTASTKADFSATDTAAEPSAGDTAGQVAEIPLIAAEQDAADASVAGHGQMANGVSDSLSQGEREGSLDASLHSDAEGSRGDASEQKTDEKHHARTNSVKKPTTFSRVSVTKSFLAKSTTAAPAVPKPGDKPSPVGTPAHALVAKPRLIAKTGTSLRDVQKARLGVEVPSGPDASKVWNKNRPQAPPPPRQFTDEELKQQYGIHLATRLQTDENGKESKWADIDDDEDDWAPETVVWMDGTKSTLTAQEAAPMENEQKPAEPQPPKPVEGVRPTLALKKKTIELGPTKTILRPGASAAAVQAKQSGSAVGTPMEKASLKVKSPAPAPSSSPWASLPPVEKVSPINPPVQAAPPTQSQPFASQDARTYEPQPPPPAREIAADTFDRSWREGEGGARELFNSANGRYEPAPEGRRSSMKPDPAFRKPAVLQRPSQGAASAAEPSAAFQSRTSSQMDGSWARRRGSSISQGSLTSGRRPSMSKGPEYSPVAVERRTSTVVGHDMRQSPKMARTEPAPPPAFSQQSAWQQQMPPRPEPGQEVEEEDPVKVQERVMREKRETAKRRREEEEQRREAEKQERLKARLASLEGAGKSRKEREAEAAAAATAPTPSSEKPHDIAAPADPSVQAQPSKPAETAALAAPALEAQSLPSAPEPAKVMQSSSDEKLPSPLPPKPQAAALPERPISSTNATQHQQPRTHLSPRANARAPFQQQTAPYKAPASSYSSPGDRKQQPFGRSPISSNDAFSPWPTTAPNGNVWGTSGIGNGTFGSSGANGFAPMPMSQQGSALPPPPGMTRPSTSTRISPQGLGQESRSPNLQQQSVAEPSLGFAPPGLESRPDPFASQGRPNGGSPAPGLGRQTHLPGPIAPPSRAPQQQPPAQRQDPLSAWNIAAQKLPHQYKSDADAAERKQKEAAPVAPRNDTIKETFKQTSTDQGRLGGPRRYDKTEYTVRDAQGSRSVQSHSPAPPSAQTQPSGPFSSASPLQQNSWKPTTENTVRIPDGSLNPAHGGLPPQQPPIGPPHAQRVPVAGHHGNMNTSLPQPATASAPTQTSFDVSPPPPETSSHPVNSGDSSHPLVRLPVKPLKPVVKLPPTSAPAQQTVAQQSSVAPSQRPPSNLGAPGGSRPLVQQEAWQARFNGLFNRTPIHTETPPSPPKTPQMQSPVLAVASSSRAAMDVAPVVSGATVSLPQPIRVTSLEGFTIDESSESTSKSTIEQMFTEELSFGSAPVINIPPNKSYPTGLPRANLLKIGPTSRFSEPLETQSGPQFDMTGVHPKRNDGYYVALPMRRMNKVVKFKAGPHKPSGTQQERKPSAKFTKSKGKESGPTSPVTNGTPSTAGSRKTSFQKAPTPAAASPAPTPNAPSETGRKSSGWAKPPKGGRSHGRRPPPVTSV